MSGPEKFAIAVTWLNILAGLLNLFSALNITNLAKSTAALARSNLAMAKALAELFKRSNGGSAP